MKRFLSLTLALLVLTTLSLRAGSDRVIQTKQLPKAAQLFLAKHFAGRTVSLAKEDRDFSGTTYDVLLADGTEIEFSSRGEWKDVDGKHTALRHSSPLRSSMPCVLSMLASPSYRSSASAVATR